MGIDGIPRTCALSEPAKVTIGPLTAEHSFLLTPSPVNLLGRDLLCKLQATITCSTEGIYLHMPEEAAVSFQGILKEENLTDLEIPTPLIDKVPVHLWGNTNTSVGLLKSADPVVIKYRTDVPYPSIKQYPLPQEAIEGLRPMIQDFMDQGILVPCVSPCNSPLLPVRKPSPPGAPVKYRLVQDLRIINNFVIPRHAITANPNTILTGIPPDSTYFSVIDLCSAFFSIRVHEKSQFLFAFTWEKGQLTWTRLPQGYVESPTIFACALHRDLQDLSFPAGSSLLIYVDDLIICSTSATNCHMDTVHLLTALADKGHKVSPKKLQYCQTEVKYLGHIIGHGTRALTTERVDAIAKVPLPKTKKQLRGFLGMSGFCRSWIPGYGELTKPLVKMTNKDEPEPLEWSKESLQNFETIKRELRSAPALGLPDYRLPFSLFVHEQKGVASGVLTQTFRGQERPVAYYSIQLDPVAKGTVGCLRAIAAAAELVDRALEIVQNQELILNVPHAVATLLNLRNCQHFSNERLNQYEAALLTPSNVRIKRVNTLNPATLLPLPDDGTPHHDCTLAVRLAERPREDLDHLPLENPDISIFTDGSSKVVAGTRQTGYAVVTHDTILEAAPINPRYSAQAAELIALIRACELSEGKRVNIYTDSKYCFGLVHATGTLWKQRGFLTAAGTQISHAPLVKRLMDSIHFPKAISVIHCKAHTNGTDFVSLGNSIADAAAQKAAAMRGEMYENEFQAILVPADVDFNRMYRTASVEEISSWQQLGAHQRDNAWVLPDGRLAMPKAWVPRHLRVLHNFTHWGANRLADSILRHWYAPGAHQFAKAVSKNCTICAGFNPKQEPRKPPGSRPWAYIPFESLQLDFAELPNCMGFKQLLVITDRLSGWPEAFPCKRANAQTVAKILMQEIIPRYGVPRRLDSDRGTHFAAEVVQSVTKAFGIKWELHTPYHPASSGQTERMNGLIKTQLGKICKATGLKWINALPLVLHNIRSQPRGLLKLSPYELLFARPSPTHTTQLPVSELETGENELTVYVTQLQRQLKKLHHYAATCQNVPLDVDAHSFTPGQWIWVKTYRRATLQPQWEGPYQILLTTPTAIKVSERSAWIHHTFCKSAPNPNDLGDVARTSPSSINSTEDTVPLDNPAPAIESPQDPPEEPTSIPITAKEGDQGDLEKWMSKILVVPEPDDPDHPPIRMQFRKQKCHDTGSGT
ncbi:protein NYNRIN-like [Zootoca vivipara]|uniref:protein NYNRIN-like n=1 Tax=Zootoca vivipara TaxID=8524 RepID=UPI00293BFBC5|nr:protein NYNRIN-like [Zootoca vivipara]